MSERETNSMIVTRTQKMFRGDTSLNPFICYDNGCDGHSTKKFLSSNETLRDEVCALGGFGGKLDTQFRHGLGNSCLSEAPKVGKR